MSKPQLVLRAQKRATQILTSVFCLVMLTQSALAMACHSFGDVHVICEDGHFAVVLIDRETQSEILPEDEDCCPHMVVSGGRNSAWFGNEAIAVIRNISPENITVTTLTRGAAKPRGPPSSSLF
jgi:streptogramin lyase